MLGEAVEVMAEDPKPGVEIASQLLNELLRAMSKPFQDKPYKGWKPQKKTHLSCKVPHLQLQHLVVRQRPLQQGRYLVATKGFYRACCHHHLRFDGGGIRDCHRDLRRRRFL
jgi:hypothetical protein